jgi:Icc protein
MIPYRVAILTDLHVDDKDKMNFGIDAKSNLLLMLQDIKKHRIHHLIITGDLCNMDPKISIYKWIKEQLDNYSFNYNIIPGNHDNFLMIKEVFGNREPYYSLVEWGRKVLFLNTADNTLPTEQLNWLKDELKECKKETIIFMHHPPTLLNCKMMDSKYPLLNIEETQKIFNEINKELIIFCGHYHDEIYFKYKNQEIFVTPSNIFQIDEKTKDFNIKTYNPGWRFVEFQKDKVNTQVFFINLEREK